MKIAFHLDTHEKLPLSSGKDLIKNSSQGREDLCARPTERGGSDNADRR